MSTIKYYLNEIAKEKQNLVNALLIQGVPSSTEEPLGTIVEKASIQMANALPLPPVITNTNVDKTSFSTAKKNIKILVSGKGDF
jgi:hypothetical protein